jgi:hypothetical protein
MVLAKDYGVQDGTTRGVLYLLREGTAESLGVLDGSTEMRSSRLDVSRILGSAPMRTSQTSAEFRVMVRRARCRIVDTLSAESFCERSQFPICVKNSACSRRCSTAGKKSVFEKGAAAFQTSERPRRQAEEKQKRIEFLEKKVQTKASVWRVLKQAGLLSRWKGKWSRKGTGFEQPLEPHQHWHVDVSYINLSGTFYYLCSVLDGSSRFLVH